MQHHGEYTSKIQRSKLTPLTGLFTPAAVCGRVSSNHPWVVSLSFSPLCKLSLDDHEDPDPLYDHVTPLLNASCLYGPPTSLRHDRRPTRHGGYVSHQEGGSFLLLS